MLTTPIFLILFAAARMVFGSPIQPDLAIPWTGTTSLSSEQLNVRSETLALDDTYCVQGLIIPFEKSDLESMRSWLAEAQPNAVDTVQANSSMSWTLESARVNSFVYLSW